MAIPTNINSDITKLSNAKIAIKNAIEAKGVTVSNSTALADYITNIGNIPTSSESLTILADIRDALIAIGADIDENTPYSQYATKIGEISMGAKKYLINDGANGWYTVDDNNWCKLFYTNIPLGSDWTYSQTITYELMGTTTYYIYQKYITLPVTFTQLWYPTVEPSTNQSLTFSNCKFRIYNQTPGTTQNLMGTTTFTPTHTVTAQIEDSNLSRIRLQSQSNSNSTPTGGIINICVEGEIQPLS